MSRSPFPVLTEAVVLVIDDEQTLAHVLQTSLTARGYDVLRERVFPPARTALLAAVTVAMLITAMPAAIPLVEYPDRETMPAAWKWISRQPGAFAILELPMPSSEADESERDAVRQIWALYHGKARADGVSGFSSPAHEGFRALMQSFPERLAIRAIAERGVRYVIVRYAEYAPEDAARIRYDLASAREMAPVFASGSDVVYSLANAELLAGREAATHASANSARDGGGR